MQTMHELAAGQLVRSGVAFAGDIARAAQRHGIEPRLLAAVAAQETGGPGSNCGRNIVGDGGHGRGLFQIDDRWHTFARTGAAMDPAKNAEYAASMISGLVRRFGGNVHQALSAYNAGSGNATGTITTWADGRRLGYADSVLRHYAELGGRSGGASPPRGAALAQEPCNLVQECIAERMMESALINQLQSFALATPASGQHESAHHSIANLDARAQRRDDDSTQIIQSMIDGDEPADINVNKGV